MDNHLITDPLTTFFSNEWSENIWFKLVTQYNSNSFYVSNNRNITMNIVKNNPTYKWSWGYLTMKIPMYDILKNKNLPWVWNDIYKNPFLTIEIINNNPNIFWNLCEFVYEHSEHAFELITKYPDAQWDWKRLCENKVLTIDFLLQHAGDNIDFYHLSCNANITIDLILENVEKHWNWSHLSHNGNISIENIIKNMNLPWDWSEVSVRDDILQEHVFNNFHLPWDFENLSETDVVTEEILLQHSELPWNFESISENKNISIEFILKHPEFQWDFAQVSCNKNLQMEHVMNNLHLPWDWHSLTTNTHMDAIDIMKHPELPWEFYHSISPKISIDFAIKYSETLFDSDTIGRLSFTDCKNSYVDSKIAFVLLSTVYEHCTNVIEFDKSPTDVEKIFADDYLVKMVCKY